MYFQTCASGFTIGVNRDFQDSGLDLRIQGIEGKIGLLLWPWLDLSDDFSNVGMFLNAPNSM